MTFQQKLVAEKSRQRAERANQQELVEASKAEATELTRQPVVEPQVLQEIITKPINFSALKAKKRPRFGMLGQLRSLVTLLTVDQMTMKRYLFLTNCLLLLS